MLVTRYIMRNLAIATLFVALVLSSVIWLTQALKLLEIIITSNAPLGTFLELVFLSLPKFLEVVLPIALTAAVLFIYNKMTMDNELIVLRASGVSHYRVARPAIILSALVSLLLLTLTTWLTPTAHANMLQLRQIAKTQYTGFLLREGVFNTLPGGLTVYMRQRNSDGELLGLLIHDARKKDEPPATITARKGRLVLSESGPEVQIFDGMRQQVDAETHALSRLGFESYTLGIEGFEQKTGRRVREPDERTLLELLRPDPKEKIPQIFLSQFNGEAHKRLTLPFLAIDFALIALTCLLAGPFDRRGQTRRVLFAIVAVVTVQSVYLGLTNWARHSTAAIPALYLLVLSLPAFCWYLLGEKGHQKIKSVERALRGVHPAQSGAEG